MNREDNLTENNKSLIMRISGMSCQGCAVTVEQVLAKVRGVESVSVDLKSATANITLGSERFLLDDLILAVKMAGYGGSLNTERL